MKCCPLILGCAFLSLVPVVTSGQPPEEPEVNPLVEKYFRDGESQRRVLVQALKETIARNRSLMGKHRNSPADLITLRRRNAEYSQLLKDNDGDGFVFFAPQLMPKVGSIGWTKSAKIRQRIDDQTALAEVDLFTGSWTVSNWLGKMPEMDYEETLVILKGIGLSRIVDGDSISLEKYILTISDTTTYENVIGGTNTVYVLEPVDGRTKQMIAAQYQALEEGNSKPLNNPMEEKPETVDPEQAATSKLNLAKRFISKGDKTNGKKWLEELLEEFPNTKAANEARGLLKTL